MTEEELVRTAARLGNETVRDLDSQRIATAVLARLEAEPLSRPRPRWQSRWLLAGLAAAAAILLVARLSLTPPVNPAEFTVLHELDDLTAPELELLLETLPSAAGSAAHPEPESLDELDSNSLERLLRSLEG